MKWVRKFPYPGYLKFESRSFWRLGLLTSARDPVFVEEERVRSCVKVPAGEVYRVGNWFELGPQTLLVHVCLRGLGGFDECERCFRGLSPSNSPLATVQAKDNPDSLQGAREMPFEVSVSAVVSRHCRHFERRVTLFCFPTIFSESEPHRRVLAWRTQLPIWREFGKC